SAYFAARSRTRLDHILFMAVAGASALATLGVLLWPDVHREIPASALALAPHLASVTLTAFAVSMLLAFAAQATFRRFFAPTAPESTRSAGSPRWRPPLELHAARLTTQRQWRALKRCADKDRAALASQQQATEKMADELRRTRDALRQ